MKNEHDRLCVLLGILFTLAWAVGSDNSLWSISRVIPALFFGIAATYSSIKRFTPLTHGVVNWLILPLLICLVGLAVSEGGILRVTLTALGSILAFLSLHRIATLRLRDETSRASRLAEGA